MWTNRLLWIVQALLAALFLFAGVTKLVLPPEALVGPVALPIAFLRFIGMAEVLGALGLVLPGLLRVHRELTPLAARGLVIIMTGATVLSAIGGGPVAAALPFMTGALTVVVALGRATWVPRRIPVPSAPTSA
ncbi:MAG TPA: DoxX family protein [Vicinamibacterales bacterium]|nr:DoxX family protein [Vicinamibacterales bacterium]